RGLRRIRVSRNAMSDHARRSSVLVAIAREAIHDPLSERPAQWTEEWLKEMAATFVTLRMDGDLRGCIGSLEAVRTLRQDVAETARAAAYRDPRFAPVGAHERDRLDVEVSVLSRREPLIAASEGEALAALRPGIDGIYLEFENCRATFLPQVWEGIPDPLHF